MRLRPVWVRPVGYAGLAVAVALLALIVAARSTVDRVDLAGLRAVHHQAVTHHWLVTTADALSAILGPTPIRVTVALALAGVLLRRRRKTADVVLRSRPVLFTALAVFGGAVVAPVIKVLVGRPRPPRLLRLGSASGYSYPSGHAVSIIIVAMMAILLTSAAAGWARTTVAVVAVTAAVLVCAARVVLGVHYPSDVLGGAGFGLAWTAVSWWLAERYGSPAADYPSSLSVERTRVGGDIDGTRAQH